MEKENKKALATGVLGLAGGLVLGYYLGGSPATRERLKPALERLKNLSKEYEKSDILNEEKVKNAIHKLLSGILVSNNKFESDG